MKNVKKLLVLAGELTIMGIVFITVGMGLSGNNSKETQINIDLTEHEYIASDTDSIEKIDISLTAEDLVFIPTDNDTISIKYSDNDTDSIYRITEENGLLKMYRNDFRAPNREKQVYDIAKHIAKEARIVKGVAPVKIYVPKTYRGLYNIGLVSGDMKLEHIISDGDFTVSSASGNIIIDGADIGGQANITSVSSDLRLSNIKANKGIIIRTTSGDIILDNISSKDECNISAESGDIDCDGIASDNISVNTTSGDIRINGISVENGVKADTTSGDVTLNFNEESTSFSVDADTVSGDVESKKGKDDKASKYIEVSSISGDVKISFK